MGHLLRYSLSSQGIFSIRNFSRRNREKLPDRLGPLSHDMGMARQLYLRRRLAKHALMHVSLLPCSSPLEQFLGAVSPGEKGMRKGNGNQMMRIESSCCKIGEVKRSGLEQ